MASKGLQEDLSVFQWKNNGWYYNDCRVQADPHAHRFVVRYLSEHFNEASILDLGSGNGALAAQMLDAGFTVSTTSWNNQCKIGHETYEINLDNGFKPEQVGGKQYNIITAIDIIEHVENPWAFLRSCSRALEDNGLMIASTPNLESARARLEWLLTGCPSDFSPNQIAHNRHISPIWRAGFLAMAAQAGLKVKEQYAFGRYVRNSRLKKKFFLLFEKLLPEHASGTTTLYLLTKTDKALNLGPANIY